jgi:DNA-binding transcriptional MocR family regulator
MTIVSIYLTNILLNVFIVTMTIWMPEIAERRGPKYLAIADAVGEAISDGDLAAGDKLPPQRDLAYDLGVTLGTITRAYQEATRRGLVGGEVGRGTYVLSPHAITAPTNRFASAQHSGENDLNFSLATPIVGEFGDMLAQTLTEITAQGDLSSLLEYQPETGRRSHLEAGAEWISRAGLFAPVDRVALTNGAQQGIMLSILSVARPGDIVLADTLTYPGIIQMANQMGFQLQGVAMDEHGMCPDDLDDICRHNAARVVYMMPSLHNPTTITMPTERRRAIAEVAERHDLYIIEDDIWGQLLDNQLPTISEMVPDRCFYVSSLSKCMAAGLRVGYVLAPASRISALRGNVRMNNWMTAPLMAEIARRWITDGTGDKLISLQRAEIKRRTEVANDLLKDFNIKAVADAVHLWLELPSPWRANDFRAEVERHGIRLLTGESFMVGRGAAPHAVRICTGGRKTLDDVRHGLTRIAEILRHGPGAGTAVI